MKKLVCHLLAILLMSHCVCGMAAGSAVYPDFSTADIFASASDFSQAREFWALREQVAALDGGLESPDKLLGVFALLSRGNDMFEKLYAYAYLGYAANQRDAEAQERYRGLKSAAAVFEAAFAPLRVQMSALSREYLLRCRADERFSQYIPQLDTLCALNGRPSAGSDILQELMPALAFPSEVASIVLNADLNPNKVIRPDGEAVPATAAEMSRALSSDDARYRREAYEEYYSALQSHRNTLAAALEAHASGRILQARLRQPGGNVSHEAQTMLGRYEMPPASADVLLSSVEQSLPIYRKGAQLKADNLGQKTVRPYDVAIPEGARAGRYTYEQAAALILDALKPLGDEYLEHARRILFSGHVNHAPREGKQAGAFCLSAGQDTDPYIHLNFDGSLSSVSTLAHELGHAVHVVLARKEQCSSLAQPALASTETAAILNEILLMRHLLKEAGDAEELRCASNAYADLIGSTLFQQTRYFSFERAVYELISEGGVLTADKGDSLWEELSAPYRGDALNMPEVAGCAWTGIPHLYRDFYVANYAFSVAAAETFADMLGGGGDRSVLNFLSAGGSQPAYELFCSMGVDFLQQSAYNDVVIRLDNLYDIMRGLEIPPAKAA